MASERPPTPDPTHTAVVTLELQRGVMGELARFTALRDAVEAVGVVSRTARVLAAARAAGATVVHCTLALREERDGAYDHVPMLRRLARDPDYLATGSRAVELVPALGAAATDLVCERDRGMAPFHGSALDSLLRAASVRTVVATGVSLNVGIPGLVIAAIDRGYEVVVPTDCVVGVPVAYGRSVIEHSLRPLATLVRADDLVAAWPSNN